MARVLALLLCLNLLAAGVAQGFDLHVETASGCADGSTLAFGDAPATGDGAGKAGAHGGGCCFGSLVLASPRLAALHAVVEIESARLDSASHEARWHSEGPERPPRA